MNVLDEELQRLRERAEKIHALRTLLEDHDMADLARAYLGMNSIPRETPVVGTLVEAFEFNHERKRGELSGKVQELAETWIGDFSVTAIVDRMKHEGFKFATDRPQVVVGDIIRKMKDEKRVIVVQEALGPKPAVYRAVVKPLLMTQAS